MLKQVKRVTIRDVAKSCGVSAATVSQILNRRESNYSSQATRALVRRRAKEMGYQPNFGYRLMHGLPTCMAAIVLGAPATIRDEYIQELERLLCTRLSDMGYAVCIAPMPQDREARPAVLDNLIQRGVEQLILIGPVFDNRKLAELARERQVTITGYESGYENDIHVDVESGMLQLLEHFRRRARSCIRAVIEPEICRCSALSRFFGRKIDAESPEVTAFRTLHRAEEGNYVQQAFDTGYRKTAELLARTPETDAIFYHSDYFALGGAKCLLDHGRVVGRDVLISGFNETRAVSTYPFPISSVSHDVPRIADRLLASFREESSGKFVIAPQVILRD